jgi:hypothetical protein
MKPGPKPRGDHVMTPAERTAAFRARRKAAGLPPQMRYSRPVDGRSKQQKRWQDSVETLMCSCYAAPERQQRCPRVTAAGPVRCEPT